jgi:protein-disulfide isomerase
MILLVVIGFAAYALFLFGYDTSNVVNGKNYGTISTSLGSPFLGSSDAPLTVIEFGNYQCVECKKWFEETRPTLIAEPVKQNKINMIFIDTYISTKNTPLASVASYCANEQKKYWAYHDMLFQNPIDYEIDIKILKQFAVKMGLDEGLFSQCMDSGKYEKKIEYSTYEAKKNGINRLPTFIIIDSAGNSDKISGALSYPIFKEKIELMQ